MEPIKLTDRKEFEIFIPKECDLDTVTRVMIRGRLFEERKTGKWIYEGKRGRFPACRCSVCGNVENADWAMISGEVNYCPNCGARMEDEP